MYESEYMKYHIFQLVSDESFQYMEDHRSYET